MQHTNSSVTTLFFEVLNGRLPGQYMPCDIACKRSPAVCQKSWALCPSSRLLSVPYALNRDFIIMCDLGNGVKVTRIRNEPCPCDLSMQ